MRMPVMALFERALRLETRSLLMCFARIGLLVTILFVLLPVQAMARYGWYSAPGLYFLEWMVWINVVLISLAGMGYFASAITEEKEEMTLGLLRMTDLNPIAILLGKSTCRLVGALLLLLVQVPFVLLAVTLGGVGVLQIAAAYSALLAYMFFICNFALLFSVVLRNTAIAGGFILLFLVLFFFGHFWCLGIEHSIAFSYGVNLNTGIWPTVTNVISLWREATPSERLTEVFRTGFTGPVVGFQVVSNLVMGVFFFLLSWVVFDWCTRQEKDAATGRRWLLGRTTRPSRIPPRLIGSRAITWKDFTFIGGGRAGVLLKFGVLVLLVGLCNFLNYQSNSVLTRKFEGVVLIWCSLITTGIWLSLEASRIFKEEVKGKTLSSLVMLPFSVHELAYRKAAGALASTLPLLSGVVLGFILAPDQVADFLNGLMKEPMECGMCFLMVSMFILFLHLTAFLSLVVKWGALPLAAAIQFVAGFFVMWVSVIFSMLAKFDGIVFFIAFGYLVVAAFLHRGIGYRLERMAAEE